MSTEWFYKIDEHEHGPIESKTLKLLAEVGQITPNTLVRKATSKSWANAHQVKKLFDAHDSSQQIIDAPPIIGQSSDFEPHKSVPQVRAVTETPPIISTAELVSPESDVFDPRINIVTPPIINGDATGGSRNHATDEILNSSNSPLTFVLTLVGLILLTIPTAWYLYSEPTIIGGNTTAPIDHPPAPNADLSAIGNSHSATNSPRHSSVINNVFTKQSQWIDPTKDQFLLTRDARLSITHVWMDTRQAEQPILNIVIKIENRSKSSVLSLQRQLTNQNAPELAIELSPYVPLIRLSTGDGQTLDTETELVSRTIPMGSEIRETYQIALTIEQTAELDQLRVAVPKAWFNKSGYWGFKIPPVMITSTKPTPIPIQIASEPNSANDNLVTAQPNNVSSENSAVTKPASDGKGVMPLSAFGKISTGAKQKNGDQPTTISELQSKIDQEKKRVPEPRSDELPQ